MKCRMKSIKRYILTLAGIFFFFCADASEDTTRLAGLRHSFGFNLRPTYVMPTHGFYRGYGETGSPIYFSQAAHLQYDFSFSPDSPAGRICPSAYQGIGIGLFSFFDHENIGTPAALYIYQGATLLHLSEHLTLGYEWNLGYSYGWRRNSAVGSRGNVLINVGLQLKHRLSQGLDLVIGPEYTHFSNGDTRFPNGGANTFGVRIGLKGGLRDNSPVQRRAAGFGESWKNLSFAERMDYDLIAFGAWRAARLSYDYHLHIINRPFPLGGIQFNPLYRLDDLLCLGPSVDLLVDRSVNLKDLVIDGQSGELVGFSYPSLKDQFSAGISFRGELTMPIFSVNIGAGVNMIMTGKDMKPFYAVFNLKGFVSESGFILIGYRLSSLQYTHNLMFGVGFRL